MRESGRITAAIEVLTAIGEQRRPAKLALKDWGLAHRFAGAKDRAWISGLVLDTLRKKRSLSWRVDADEPRALVLACLAYAWRWSLEAIAEAAAQTPHGPGALTAEETAALGAPRELGEASEGVAGDVPDWLVPHMARVFPDDAVAQGVALAVRAPMDLRVNTLKAEPDRVRQALASLNAQAAGLLTTALRVGAPEPGERAGHVESIPAFQKGWLEVQDLGSQVAAAAAGDVLGAQVLDYCAGGGGKTLALAAAMSGTGQVYAYDADARRLAPAYERVRRAGARNVQLRSPAERQGAVDDLVGKMDLVFVDAPCTGSGVWRRQPDAKWRLTERALADRLAEQDAVLTQAARHVRPGGRLIYVTCSLFAEENEDRLAAFAAHHTDFTALNTFDQIAASGLLEDPSGVLARCRADALAPGDRAALRLTPARCQTDGFFIAVLIRGGG